MMVQASGIIGANLYVASDAPLYKRGNSIILGIIAMNLVIIYPATYVYYRARNAWKAKRWDALTVEQQSLCKFASLGDEHFTDLNHQIWPLQKTRAARG